MSEKEKVFIEFLCYEFRQYNVIIKNQYKSFFIYF